MQPHRAGLSMARRVNALQLIYLECHAFWRSHHIYWITRAMCSSSIATPLSSSRSKGQRWSIWMDVATTGVLEWSSIVSHDSYVHWAARPSSSASSEDKNSKSFFPSIKKKQNKVFSSIPLDHSDINKRNPNQHSDSSILDAGVAEK